MKRDRIGGLGSGHFRVLVPLAIGYAALAMLSVALFRPGIDVICLWVANVFAVAVLIRNPAISLVPAGIALLVAALAANLVSGNGPELSLVFATANVTGMIAGTALVRWRGRWSNGTDPSAAGYAETLLLVGLVAPLVAGILFSGQAALFDMRPFLSSLLTWWAGDALAFAIFLPVLLLASRASAAEAISRRAVAVLIGSVVGTCAAVALAVALTGFPLVLVMVPLLVASFYARPFEMAVISAATGLTLTIAAMTGQVPTLREFPAIANGYQLAVAIVIILPLLCGLAIERSRIDRQRIRESEQRFRRAMDDSAIGVVIVALDGRIMEVNPGFAAMLGYGRHELENLTFFHIAHPEDIEIGSDSMREIRAGRASSYRFEKRYIHKDGHAVWTNVSGSVIRDDKTGAPLYLVSQIEDIDARKRSAAAIAEAETRWNFALASAGQGVWDVDVRKGGVTYSATWTDMLGYEARELDGDPGYWRTLIHPEDVERVLAADREHFEGATPYFESEFRMRRKDGTWIWILDRGKVIERDLEGNVVRAIGSLTDITRQKAVEQNLARSAQMLVEEKERLRVTLESIGDAVICTDAANRVTFMNPVAEKLTAVSRADALGKPLGRVYRSVDEETGERLALRRPGLGESMPARHNSRAILVRDDGSNCSIREVVSPIVNDSNEFGGLVIVFQDFTDARTLQRELAYAASHDALTGAANRSSFIRTMTALADETRRDRSEHQFLYLDLDHFKTVNDTAGHGAGDALLQRVTETIRSGIRADDIVARLGGDEFAIIFQRCSVAEATVLAERLVASVASLGFVWEGREHPIGASAGLATLRYDSGEIDEVIARADEACYSAKAAGRSCVFIADETPRDGLRRALAS